MYGKDPRFKWKTHNMYMILRIFLKQTPTFNCYADEDYHSNKNRETECEGWVVSSESCSFQAIGAKYYREVLPGKMTVSSS